MLLIRCCARDELLISWLILECGCKGRSVGKPGSETFPWCFCTAATIQVLLGMVFPRRSPQVLHHKTWFLAMHRQTLALSSFCQVVTRSFVFLCVTSGYCLKAHGCFPVQHFSTRELKLSEMRFGSLEMLKAELHMAT